MKQRNQIIAVLIFCPVTLWLAVFHVRNPSHLSNLKNGVIEQIKKTSHKFVMDLTKMSGNNTNSQGTDNTIVNIPTETTIHTETTIPTETTLPTETTTVGGERPRAARGITAVMFSTWVRKPEKHQINLNVLKTWGLWAPSIVPVIFTDDVIIRQQARTHGWGFRGEPKKACSGVPLYREMFREAIETHNSDLYGFVNGDIAVGNGLLPSLQAVVRLRAIDTKPVMVVFRRTNVDFTQRAPLENVDNLTAIAREGRNMTDGSSDGIFTNRLFPWDHVPDIVPGRLGIAMWIVSYAREIGADVIDITDTTTAVHMSTQSGNRESVHHRDSRCNHRVYDTLGIKPQSWFCGFIRCAAFKTVTVTRNNVTEIKVVDKRAENSKRCGECNMNLKPLMDTVF